MTAKATVTIEIEREVLDAAQALVAAGEHANLSEAVGAVLAARHIDPLDDDDIARIRALIAEGDADIAAGRVIDADDIDWDEIKRAGRRRLGVA